MLFPSMSVIFVGFVITAILMAANWYIWSLTYSGSHLARRVYGRAPEAGVGAPAGGGFKHAA